MASTGIPLHCNICPKKPNFSDVSHLLTHIASKGHLSHYYKVKVRSSSEEASRRLIESYDRWYMEWRVEDLMSDRMSMKDKKKTRSRAGNRSNQLQPSRVPQNIPRTRGGSTLLDPRLADQHHIKDEPRPTPPPFFDQIPYSRQYDPRMVRLWPSASPSSFGNASTEYDYPNDRLDMGNRRRYLHNVGTSAVLDDNDNDNEEMDVFTGSSECTKLKGVYWPGMDIFDSATPEMRRKRNQKKDISVVEQLEVNSQEVEPTELIFTPHGSFKRQRRISGSSYEESSPLKSELSPRESRFKRPALADLEPNIPRRPRQSARLFRPATSSTSRNVFENDHSDYGVHYSNIAPPSKRRPFEVFQDHPASYHTTQPAGFNYLTSEFHYPQPPELTESRNHSKSYTHVSALAYHHHHQGDKENYEQMHYPYSAFYTQLPTAPSQPFASYPMAHNHDHHANFYSHSAAMYNSYLNAETEPEQDDQRTITAPPSEA